MRAAVRRPPWRLQCVPPACNAWAAATRQIHYQAAAQAPASSSSSSAQVQHTYDPGFPFDMSDFPPHRVSAQRPPPASVRLDDLYEPQEADFDPPLADDPDAHYDPDLAASVFEPRVAEEDAPVLPTYEKTLKKTRRKRRAVEPETEPLPPGTVPDDGQTRFDWRAKALSQTQHAEGVHWYPDAWRTRVPPPKTKLSEVKPLFNELQRYNDQYVGSVLADGSFLPLLDAEQEEAELQFMERLKEWPDDKLRREGFMLDEMGGSTDWQPKYKVHGKVVSFAKTGSDATSILPPHQFE